MPISVGPRCGSRAPTESFHENWSHRRSYTKSEMNEILFITPFGYVGDGLGFEDASEWVCDSIRISLSCPKQTTR